MSTGGGGEQGYLGDNLHMCSLGGLGCPAAVHVHPSSEPEEMGVGKARTHNTKFPDSKYS